MWLRFWPIAVEVTNAEQSAEEEVNLNTTAWQLSDEQESMNLDTWNTAVGKFVAVFLAAVSGIREKDYPFKPHSSLCAMRNAIIAATGRSRLIALHRMIETLPYILSTDREWTQEYLISPLMNDDKEALVLWHAIGRRIQPTNVLKIIGDSVAKRAVDPRLGRKTRLSLVFSLIVECLHAFREQRHPAVDYSSIQQVIRLLDDEVRAYAAEAVQQFLREVSESLKDKPSPPSPEQLFQTAAAPFLQQVWPQERSLATPGVSRALADLPATARGAFAEAVEIIERFLVPFNCWSLLDYGFYGEEDGGAKFSIIDDNRKAEALLRLFDRTIGTIGSSVVPIDLADALNQIRKVAPILAKTQVFRRLATAARRS